MRIRIVLKTIVFINFLSYLLEHIFWGGIDFVYQVFD